MKLNRRSFLATGAAATGVIGLPAIVKAQPKEYVVAQSLPMTGPFATAGQLVSPASKMFEAITNAEGGIGGVPIRVEVEDSGYVPQRALANYQRALATEDNLVMYFGDSTGFMKLVAPELKGKNATLMGSTSFATELANPEKNPYQYVAGPTYEDQFDILLQNIANEGGSTVAFIYSNTEFGRDPLAHGRQKAEELGIEVVLEESTKAEGADIPTHVTKLAQSNAEYCILQGYVTGVWPQLIGGARQLGLQTKFMGTFWGMEKLIADRVTAEAGPFLEGYLGVMPYRYSYDQEDAPRYRTYAAFQKEHFAGTPLENYMPTWGIEALCSMEIGLEALRRVANKGLELTADNAAEELAGIQDWDSGGFFGPNVSMVSNKIGTGRVYQYSTESGLFEPRSDWLSV
ncbi:amino acid/amide ABC transporter substrate-binding protein, HAAT family [Salinihabitans flavidus]|uniref:Amino acid/amide ABC transporter substrate-binding protein, HAAT family n=1 Tax=Salinihabitans flavidus TaxID=569882 RepID=A0A1H8P8B3_9RHOB|nr:ABC transporter substrate-binding protein [Salinihabitans flavidus]SEO38027.1 amino acid/amide ABC transporter substrate-binding protein, HAAT family [Salinihabitans flavidus]